jgi:glycosyltransferase involved in cell wall biosynthesis
MHVLLTANAPATLTNYRSGLIEALIGDGHRVTALLPLADGDGGLERLGCRVRNLEMSRKSLSPVSNVSLIIQMRRILAEERPDIVFSFTIKNNIFGALATRSLDIPFVPNLTGLGTAFLSGPVFRRVAETLYRVAFRGVPCVIFQNRDDAALFRTRGLVRDTQIRLVPGSGINLSHFPETPLPGTDGTPVFLLIGRLLEAKGVFEFIEAARRVNRNGMRARFCLLGPIDTENRHAIPKAQLNAWIDEGVIDYLGETDDVRPHIVAAHCIVLPSYREGLPRSLLEASAMSRPMVATDVPGCRELVVPFETGVLCVVKSAESLAEALETMLALPIARWREMGQQARRKVEREFDERLVIDTYRDLLSRL